MRPPPSYSPSPRLHPASYHQPDRSKCSSPALASFSLAWRLQVSQIPAACPSPLLLGLSILCSLCRVCTSTTQLMTLSFRGLCRCLFLQEVFPDLTIDAAPACPQLVIQLYNQQHGLLACIRLCSWCWRLSKEENRNSTCRNRKCSKWGETIHKQIGR